MMARRRFLLGSLGVIAAAGLVTVGIAPTWGRSQIASYIKRRLYFLKLDAAGVDAFARDQVDALLAKRPTWNRMKYHFLAVFTKSFSRYDHSIDTRSRSQRMEDGFVQTYLLSSTFFTGGADESEIVQYVGFYDPMHPCGNPFARPVVDTRSPSASGSSG